MNKKVLIGIIVAILAIIAVVAGVIKISHHNTKNNTLSAMNGSENDNMLVGENEQKENEEDMSNSEQEKNTTKSGSKTLVVYYSAQNHTKAVAEKIAHLQADVKALQSENESLKSKLAQGSLGDVMNQIVDVKGVKLLASRVEGIDMNGLRDLGDQLKEKIGEGVVVLAAVNGGKVNLLAMATDAAQKAGAHAGNLIKGVAAIVGGGGGGRPNMAQAGGKNPEKAQEAIDAAAEILEQQIH